ncbi:MAG: endonuclease/exonuclease/phosphatase family protein [Bacteroidota bacterium]
MPTIIEQQPPAVQANIAALRAHLDAIIPAKKLEKNLLIATWNIRAFGDLTTKWEAGLKDSPKRDFHSVACIAEILNHFDVIAVQEVKANLKGLRDCMKLLGDNYSFLLTDVNQGNAGNDERMAYIFDNRRVQLSGLACELVMPDQWRTDPKGFTTEQFVRSPYAVSFKTKGQTFVLVTMHLIYGNKSADRMNELKGIARWMASWAKDVYSYHQNLILLGDFNIDERGDVLSKTFMSEGLFVPPQLADPKVLRSIFDESKFYDQIAWFNGTNKLPQLSMEFVQGGFYPFTEVALANRNLKKTELSWMLSDHYPLWAEFKL